MKPARMTVFILSLTMLLQVVGTGWIDIEQIETTPTFLEEEQPIMEASSPGHVVFAQYITSDNCGYCMSYGSPAHKQLKSNYADEYVYLSYHSASYGDTDDAESGNINPILAVSHLQETGGAPKSSFGDSLPLEVGCGSNTCWDAAFSAGGNMPNNVNDFSMRVVQSDNGDGTSDVTISSKYIGAGTAPSNLKLYAAIAEEVCNSHAYTDGTKGGNCWEAWLLNGGAYASNSGNVGNGTGFQSITLNSNQWTNYSWTVPNNLVNGGGSNMIAIGALYSGWSTSSANENVYHASDSTMGPLVDVGITDFVATNDGGHQGYVNGDTLTLTGTITNLGDEVYNSGGDVGFYRSTGPGQEELIGQLFQMNSLTPSATQSFSVTADSTSYPANAYDTTYRMRITNLIGDKNSDNNVDVEKVMHDQAPTCNNPTLIGSNEIQRTDSALIEVKGISNDGVDSLATMHPELEFSVAGQNAWTTQGVSGGDNLIGVGSGNERFEFVITPDLSMPASDYDIRTKLVDARGHSSPWVVKADAFSLLNAEPTITANPVPTVKVDTLTAVSMIGYVADAETPLSQLNITSNSPNFVGWDAASEQISVQFNQIQYDLNGNAIQSGIYITVSDGEDTTGGTLLFNVIENGMPRWGPVPSIDIMEGGGDGLMLSGFLTDTDQDGNSVSTSGLQLAIIANDNTDLITASLNGFTLNIDTVDDDNFGQATLTLRASDGVQYSDTTVIVHVQNINDAPRLDLSTLDGITLKKGEQRIIDMSALITDPDDPVEEAWVTAYAEPQIAARYSLIDGTLTLKWEEAGMKDVTITVTDSHDASNMYSFQVEVISHLPLEVSKDDTSSHLYVSIDNAFVGRVPTINMDIGTDIGLTNVESKWQICNSLTGLCYDIQTIQHPDSGAENGWAFQIPFQRLVDNGGLVSGDQLKMVSLTGVDADDTDRMAEDYLTWDIFNHPPVTDMETAELDNYIAGLEDKIDSLEDEIAQLPEGSSTRDAKQVELDEAISALASACNSPDANCESGLSGNGSSATEGMNVVYIGGAVLSVIILALLSMLLFGGRREDDSFVDYTKVLPSTDNVANSKFGGAAPIFQQQVAPPAGVMAPGATPLPPEGLPAGWTMEQWQYYGHQYQK